MGRYALGIWVGTGFLHGALVEQTEDGWAVPIYRSWSRSDEEEESVPFDEPAPSGPGMEGEADDVMIDFDDEGGDGDMMFGAEFDDLGQNGGTDGVEVDNTEAWDFRAALNELLDECEEKGYEDPEIAFCSEASMVDQVELRLPEDEDQDYPEEEKGKGRPLPASRSRLLDLLDDQYEGAVESERVGFVAMNPSEDGRNRVLAFIARPGGSVITTLSGMQEQAMARGPKARVLDVEVPLFASLARSAMELPLGAEDKAIVVRAGVEDTTILFMRGNTLWHAEHLPEITVEDPLETICSRVLLLQDEYQMGEVQHVLLASEDDEEGLADAFRSYFSRSQLRLLRETLPGHGDQVPENVHVGAVGTALRMLEADDLDPFFQGVNLLPKECTPSWLRLPVGWSVPALLMLLALTTLGFVWYFIANANAISERRSELRRLEAQLEQVNVEDLRRRNDSVAAAAARYTEGMSTLDRLLEGRNKWSRTLARTTDLIDDVRGISLRRWNPREKAVTVTGMATARSRVVQFARRQNAQINKVTFTDVRDYPLYDFELTVPLPSDTPEVVSYWRERGDSTQQKPDSSQGGDGPTATIQQRRPARPSTYSHPADGAFLVPTSGPVAGGVRPEVFRRTYGRGSGRATGPLPPPPRQSGDRLRDAAGLAVRFSKREQTGAAWEHRVVLDTHRKRLADRPRIA